MRKGFTGPAGEMIQWIGLILICIIILYVIITWASAGAHVQRGVEQGSLMYTISSSVSALSTAEEGKVVRYLTSHFDIEIECEDDDPGKPCSVVTAPYDGNGKRQKESNPVSILGSIEPVFLENVNKITLTKQPGVPVVLSGESVADSFNTGLNVQEFGPMCFDRDAKFRDLITRASERYGVEKDLISAHIISESSWDSSSHRYEPGFQLRYLEGTSWEDDPAWLEEGDSGAMTIRQWFSQHPERIGERSGLSDTQLGLIAQVRVSASYGLMQVLYTTAVENCGYSGEPEGLKDPEANIDCGTSYIRKKQDQYGTLPDSVSAYNAGEPIWRENLANRQYTEKVIGLYNAFRSCEAIA